MKADDMVLVSVDDHVVEPPQMFDGRLPTKLQEYAPRVETQPDGSQVWTFAGRRRPQIGLNAVAGRPPEEYGMEPVSFDEMRAGVYDIHERVKDMSAGGQLAGMCFPSFPRFCGQFFAEAADKDLAAAVVRAYNDWHIDEWAGTYPGRIIPLALAMVWDAELSAAEMRRVAERGVHAVSFSENPAMLGYPSLHSDYWDPFWQACNDNEIRVCMHIGSSSQVPVTAPDAPIDVTFVLSPIAITYTAADIIYSPILRKFPDIKFVLSEGGIGWIPYFLERLDYVYEHHHRWTGQDFGGQLPSQLFNERLLTCFVDDAFGIESLHRLNTEAVMWEADYPHSDSVWPHAPEILDKRLVGVPDALVDKITHENAIRHFKFDAFAGKTRAQCTVGALRAEVADHDISIRSQGTRKSKTSATGGNMHQMFAPKADTTGGAWTPASEG